MSSRHGVRASAHGASTGGSTSARGRGRPVARDALAASAWRAEVSQWSGYAWGTIAATTAFIALTCWWLTQDRSIPIYDAGDHLETALLFHHMLSTGETLGPINHESPYPPFALLVGALSIFVGGVSVASPIIGENLVFVSLMTLGCYQTGRLLFGPKAGMLAAIFVLGSDLLTAQFHVFMLDAPEAAIVAVSVWLLLACDDFGRVGVAGVAGLAVGIGLITKVQYPSFVMGIVLLALLRGGWRNRRGLLAFAVPAVIVAAPWYIDQISQFSTFLQVSTANKIVVPGDIPTTLSLANFAWYFWNILNSQLLVPLFVLLLGGTAWMIPMLYRHRREAWGAKLSEARSTLTPAPRRAGATTDQRVFGARLEFFAGAFVAWLFITVTPSHDLRYALPLLPYLAVIATGWIVYLPRAWSWAAIALLALGVAANTLGTTFGAGETLQVKLVQPLPQGEEEADAITFYSTTGFLVAGPNRDGDVPGLLAALKREGVSTVAWSGEQSREPDFDTEGLLPLANIAGLAYALTREPEFASTSSTATLIHLPISAQGSPPAPPCTRLSDGTGVWVGRFNPASRRAELYCPSRNPQFYGPV